MTDNIAILDGFTEEWVAECPDTSLFILVKPGTDLDGRFKAWDMDMQEYLWINGWLFTFEKPTENIGLASMYDPQNIRDGGLI